MSEISKGNKCTLKQIKYLNIFLFRENIWISEISNNCWSNRRKIYAATTGVTNYYRGQQLDDKYKVEKYFFFVNKENYRNIYLKEISFEWDNK